MHETLFKTLLTFRKFGYVFFSLFWITNYFKTYWLKTPINIYYLSFCESEILLTLVVLAWNFSWRGFIKRLTEAVIICRLEYSWRIHFQDGVQGWQVSTSCWQEAVVPCHMDPSWDVFTFFTAMLLALPKASSSRESKAEVSMFFWSSFWSNSLSFHNAVHCINQSSSIWEDTDELRV